MESNLYFLTQVRCKLVELEEVLLAKEREKNDLSKASQNLLKEKTESDELLRNKQHCIELLQMEKVKSSFSYLSSRFTTCKCRMMIVFVFGDKRLGAL